MATYMPTLQLPELAFVEQQLNTARHGLSLLHIRAGMGIKIRGDEFAALERQIAGLEQQRTSLREQEII